MKTALRIFLLLVIGLAAEAGAAAPSIITYQGRLKENNQPVNGDRAVEILLCDALTGGSCQSSGVQYVSVSTGLFKSTFTVPGGVDLAAGSWYLELNIESQTLSPRERLSSVPYALYSSNADYSLNTASAAYAGALAASAGAGVVSSTHIYLVNGSSLIVSGNVSATAFFGNGSGLTGVTGATGTDSTKVLKAGDTMTGPLTLSGSTLTVGGASGVAASRLRLAAGVYLSSETSSALGAGVAVSSNIYVVGFASATKYYGDGSALTGVAAGTSLSAANLTGGGSGTIPYQSGTGTTAMLAAGAAGSLLQANGAGAPSWITAASANTAGAVVKRDGSGNFAAGAITAVSFTGALTGNADTVTNGVYTSGSYADPAWLTGLAASKLTGAISPALVNLSTVTSELGGKLSSSATVPNGLIDLSTVTARLVSLDASTSSIYAALQSTASTVSSVIVSTGVLAVQDSLRLLKAGDTMTGPLTLAGSTLTVAGPAGAAISRLRLADGVFLSSEASAAFGAGVNISSNVYIVGFASATKYYGDGSALTGVAAGTSLTAANLAGGGSGYIPYQSAAGATAMLAAGAAGSLLQTNGAGAPSWITAASANTAGAVVKRDGSGNFSAGVITATGFTGDLTGNADTVTNGVYTSGSYSDPAWLTAFSASKLIGAISPSLVDLSTVTSALSGKLSASAPVPNALVDLSTVTARLVSLDASTASIYSALQSTAASLSSVIVSTGLLAVQDSLRLLKAGDTMTGPLTLAGSTLTVAGPAGAAISRLRLADGVFLSSEASAAFGAGVNISSNVYIVGFASATKYYGDGSALTGVAASSVPAAGVQPGKLSSSVEASSVAVNSVYDGAILSMSASKLTGPLPAISGAALTNLPGDGLGNHAATTTLNMSGFGITGVSTVTVSSITTLAAGVTVSTNLFVLKGNLGIGTNSPFYKLEVAGGIIAWGNQGDPQGMLSNTANTAIVRAYTGDALTFETNGTNERIRIDTAGRVGVGTTAPSSRFDVANGSVTIRGTDAALIFENAGRVISPETSAAFGAGLRVSTNVYIVGFSSAGKYYGDGSALTGISVSSVPAGGVQPGSLLPGVITSSSAVNSVYDGAILSISASKLTGPLPAISGAALTNLPGDGLGNHVATTTLNMGGYGIVNLSTINAAGPGVVFATSVFLNNGGVSVGTYAPSGVFTAVAPGKTWPSLSISTTGSLGIGAQAHPNIPLRLSRSVDPAADFGPLNEWDAASMQVRASPSVNTANSGVSVLGAMVEKQGAYQMSYLNGVWAEAVQAGSGNMDEMVALWAGNSWRAGGTGWVTNDVGVYIEQSSGVYNRVNNIALKISPVGGGTNNYAILYSTGSPFVVMGSGLVGIGTAAPAGMLDIVSGATDKMAQIWRSTGGVILGSMSASGVMSASKFAGDGSGLTNLAGASPVNSALTSANIWVGNGSNLAAAVAMSNDATMSNTGAVTLKNTGTAGTYRSVTTDAQGRVTVGTNPTTFSGYGITAETSANLATAITNETGSGSLVFAVQPVLSTITIHNGNLGSSAGSSLELLAAGGSDSNNDRFIFSSTRISNGADWQTAGLMLNRRVDSANMGYIRFGNQAADLLTFGGAQSEYMRVDGAGNVGIGVTVPRGRLHVSSATNSADDMLLAVSSGPAESQIVFGVAGNGEAGILRSLGIGPAYAPLSPGAGLGLIVENAVAVGTPTLSAPAMMQVTGGTASGENAALFYSGSARIGGFRKK